MTDRDITLREFVEHGIEHMEVLRVQPGDVCVMRSEQALSMEAMAAIRRGWELVFTGFNCPALIVLDRGRSLSVLRADAQPASESEP